MLFDGFTVVAVVLGNFGKDDNLVAAIGAASYAVNLGVFESRCLDFGDEPARCVVEEYPVAPLAKAEHGAVGVFLVDVEGEETFGGDDRPIGEEILFFGVESVVHQTEPAQVDGVVAAVIELDKVFGVVPRLGLHVLVVGEDFVDAEAQRVGYRLALLTAVGGSL